MYMFYLKKMISKFSKNISNVKLHDMHDFCGFVQISLVWKWVSNSLEATTHFSLKLFHEQNIKNVISYKQISVISDIRLK